MKKIFAILTLFLAFSFSANAQQEESLSDLATLKATVNVDPSSEQAIKSIFYDKHKFLLQSNLTEEMKQEKFTNTEERLAAALTPSQLEKLKKNTELYQKLTR